MTLPGVDPDAAERYRRRLDRLLRDGDDAVTARFEAWRDAVERHHGAVFDAIDVDTAADDAASTRSPASENAPASENSSDGGARERAVARRLFLDTATFDATVRGFRRAVETAADVTVRVPESPRSFERLHRLVGVDVRVAVPTTELEAVDAEAFRTLYESTVSPAFRRVFGEYYTPRGLAELAVDAVVADPAGYAPQDVAPGGRRDSGDESPSRGERWFADARVLDPGCGAGAFLTAALRRKLKSFPDDRSSAEVLDRLTDTVVGIDVNPVAATAARAAYLVTVLPLLCDTAVTNVHIPVGVGDALGLGDADDTVPFGDDGPVGEDLLGAVDVLLGNPPWVPWERLSPTLKRRLREGPVERLDLFDHEGATARLGHANDDLSLPFVWSCLDRYLAPGGAAAFVLKRDLLRGAAGRVLRSGRVGDRPLSTRCVHDFSGVDPFDGVGADAALYLFDADVEADAHRTSESGRSRPATATATDRSERDAGAAVPTVVWSWGDREPRFGSLAAMEATLTRTRTGLRALDPSDPASPWVRADAEDAALGDCEYELRHGVKDDAKAVFSLDREALSALEPTHVFPYLRSKHVVKWGLFGYDLFLVPHRHAGEDNEAELRRETPRTYAYLDDHRDRLLGRGSSWFDSGPFYTLFGLGPYTWAPYKVVWCRLGFKPHFTVVSDVDDPDLGRKPVVPGDHCMFLSTEHEAEAHYLCALLNSAPYQRCLRDVAGRGKASLSKQVVSSLALPPWRGTDAQRRLADLSRRAHDIVPGYVDRSKRAYNDLRIPELAAVESEVDAAAERFLASR